MTSESGWEMGLAPSPARSVSSPAGRGGPSEVCLARSLLLHQTLESVTPRGLLQRRPPSPTLMVQAIC